MRRVLGASAALAFVAMAVAFGCGDLIATDPPPALPDAATAPSATVPTTTIPTNTPPTPDGAPPGARGCSSSSHAFCEDFEEDNGTAAWWYPLGTLLRTSTRFVSPPMAGMGSLFRRDAGPPVYAGLGKSIDGPWRRTVVEFDVYLEPPSWQFADRNVGLVCIALYAGPTEHLSSCLLISETFASIEFAGTPAMQAEAFPVRGWVHVKADLEPTKAFTVDVTGYPRLSAKGSPPIAPDAATDAGGAPYTVVQVGLLGYTTPTPAVTAYLDDVTIDFAP